MSLRNEPLHLDSMLS